MDVEIEVEQYYTKAADNIGIFARKLFGCMFGSS